MPEVRIIYHCPEGDAAAAAAAHHLGLPREKIEALPGKPLKSGRIYPVGTDGRGNDICVMARGQWGPLVSRALLGIVEVFGLDTGEIMLVDAGRRNFSPEKVVGEVKARLEAR